MNKASQNTAPVQAIIDDKVNASALICALGMKIADCSQTSFDFFGELNRLAKEVAPQIALIPGTFPNYTPHDWHLHVRRLFGVADRLIGEERYALMSSAELFVFAASLFAHDWGMAVSEGERESITTGGKQPEGAAFRLLENEASELRSFARNKGLEIKEDGSCPSLRDDGYWREYVRATHAWRSGLRAQHFFEQTDGGVAQAVAAACEGHWLDLADIDSESRFPAFLNVLDQRINLRAVVIYVRLVDLFDIGEDRTPYALWRFVGPRDNKAATEWSKHRSLRPINVEPYQSSRRVVIDGTACDPDIWAALLDLRDYIEEQLCGCMDLMARHPDERHTLNLAPVANWKVKAQGFTPIQLRFGFDRTRMFEILSDEIYQGDRYVFLRELLQNSIDAIRMRRAKQALRPQDGIAEGLIEFKVIHGNDGDATVTCRDNGIGMDEYILRNYLAVAGVSYYRSDDFSREGLNLDPISRFGIGILSCFMVADSIELTTYRDPRFYPTSKPLRVVVPSIDKQFHVFQASPDSNVGTEVIVKVLGKKLKNAISKTRKTSEVPQNRLQVTSYLAAIAGFVEVPVLVEEDGNRTLILHPDAIASEAQAKYGNVLVRQLNRAFPWEDIALPQDLANAKQILAAKTLDIKSDLGLDDLEGWVSLLVPRDTTTDFTCYSDAFRTKKGRESVILRWKEEHSRASIHEGCLCRSSSHPTSMAVYQNGILVPNQDSPDEGKSIYEPHSPIPPPLWRVGLSSTSSGRPDISRCTLVDATEPWQKRLRTRLVQKLWEEEENEIKLLPSRERFIALGRFAGIYGLSPDEILPLISDTLPIPFLEMDGSINFIPKLADCGSQIYASPAIIADCLESLPVSDSQQKMLMQNWRGERCLILFEDEGPWNSAVLYSAFALESAVIMAEFQKSGCRFLTPPRQKDMFLPQFLWKRTKKTEKTNVETLLTSLITDHSSIDQERLTATKRSIADSLNSEQEPLYTTEHSLEPTIFSMETIEFNPPFENYFAFGGVIQNLRHPTVQMLLRCHLALFLARIHRTYSPERLGHFSDILNAPIGFIRGYGKRDLKKLNELLASAWDVGRKLGLTQLETPPTSLSVADFVPRTIRTVGKHVKIYGEESMILNLPVRPVPFGAVITETSAKSEKNSRRK